MIYKSNKYLYITHKFISKPLNNLSGNYAFLMDSRLYLPEF